MRLFAPISLSLMKASSLARSPSVRSMSIRYGARASSFAVPCASLFASTCRLTASIDSRSASQAFARSMADCRDSVRKNPRAASA